MDRRRRFVLIGLLLPLLAPIPVMPGRAQGAGDADPKARCTRLLEFWLRHGGAKGEGAGTSEIDRKGAEADCAAGRYQRGIKTMEDLLRRNGYTVPPA
jgi:hypothetical protein